MASLTYLVISAVLSVSCAQTDCVIEKPVEQHFEMKLLDHLEKCNTHLPPIANSTDGIRVSVVFFLKSFNLENDEQTFNMFTTVKFSWQDERLKWNPDDFGGLKKIHLEEFVVFWTPGFKALNAEGFDDLVSPFVDPCTVNYNGSVTCFPKLNHAASCNSTLADWPYDIRICSFKFGQQPEYREGRSTKIMYSFDHYIKPMVMYGSEIGAGWRIVDFKHSENPDSEEQLKLVFILRRQSAVLAAVVVVPSITVSILTMTCLLLDVTDDCRLGLACFSLIGHFIFLTEISEDLPTHSADTPLVLFYIRGSLLMTTFVTVLSLFLKRLLVEDAPPPLWISQVNEYVFSSRGKVLVYPRWGSNVACSDSEKSGKKSIKDWADFANLINTLTIVLFSLIYLILYFILMPQPKKL